MANIPISDISTVAETLENKDLILVSKKNEEKYTSAKMTGEKLKKSLVDSLFDIIYPVGSIYISINAFLPDNFSGAWERIAEGRCLWGSDSSGSNSGTTIEAGLPNITGQITPAWTTTEGVVNGSFSAPSNYTGQTFHLWTNSTGGDNIYHRQVTFNASKSNTIYGNSETVQPPALIVSMWKRIQ